MERIVKKATAVIPANGTAVVLPTIPVTDGELLMRYARHGDERAFAELVEKHGRLVWTVCWQILREHHAIEDAFQATFFILAKRARTIRSCDSLCGWLYRVAYRTALRSRMTTKRKALVELMNDELSTLDEKLKSIEQHEQRAVLMEELQTLPEQYQMPLVLCYLEGKSRRVAAEELGTTLESVKGRLTRGRQMLRHRLIRRGVSLSIAMAAMAVPVKSATAAVTPKLVTLTVTGCAKWLAGAASLTAAKIATSVTASSQAIQLAHQGTVAMTIASFAKPAVVAVALLGAVSATMAVDSTGTGGSGDGKSQPAALLASADADNDQSATIDNEETIQIIAGEEEAAAEEPLSADAVPPMEPTAPTVSIEAPQIQFSIADPAGPMTAPVPVAPVSVAGKPRIPAPARVPQRVEMRGPAGATILAATGVPQGADVLIPTPPTAPMVYEPQQFDLQKFALQNEFRFNNPFAWQSKIAMKQQLEVATIEQRVAELQLQSKELEIRAFDEVGEMKEKLLAESKKTLLMAEAEQLKLKIEAQRTQIEELEKAVKEQAEAAAHAGEDAKQAAKHAKHAAISIAHAAAGFDQDIARKETIRIEVQAEKAAMAQARQGMELARKTAEEARASAMADAKVAIAAARAEVGKVREKTLRDKESRVSVEEKLLQPGQRVKIEVVGAFPDRPINDVYTIEPMGTVALGASYGRVNIAGMPLMAAEQAIVAELKKTLTDVQVQVTLWGKPKGDEK